MLDSGVSGACLSSLCLEQGINLSSEEGKGKGGCRPSRKWGGGGRPGGIDPLHGRRGSLISSPTIMAVQRSWSFMGGLYGRMGLGEFRRKSLNWTLEDIGWRQVEYERCLGSQKGCGTKA